MLITFKLIIMGEAIIYQLFATVADEINCCRQWRTITATKDSLLKKNNQ